MQKWQHVWWGWGLQWAVHKALPRRIISGLIAKARHITPRHLHPKQQRKRQSRYLWLEKFATSCFTGSTPTCQYAKYRTSSPNAVPSAAPAPAVDLENQRREANEALQQGQQVRPAV